MAILIQANGLVQSVRPKDKKTFSLNELQAFVGGNIELVRLAHKTDMYLNEEGKLDGLPSNLLASYMFVHMTGTMDEIKGDVIICGPWETGDEA